MKECAERFVGWSGDSWREIGYVLIYGKNKKKDTWTGQRRKIHRRRLPQITVYNLQNPFNVLFSFSAAVVTCSDFLMVHGGY